MDELDLWIDWEDDNMQQLWRISVMMESFVPILFFTFVNLLVTSYEYLQHGCYQSDKEPRVECGTGRQASLTSLPEAFKPLKLTQEMDDQWMDLIKDLKL